MRAAAAPLRTEPFHARSVEQILSDLRTSRAGLEVDDARTRLEGHGPNRLPRKRPRSVLSIYLSQFKSAFIYLLLAAAVVTFVLGEFGDSLFILFVLQLNAVVGTYQERRAEQRVEALKSIVPTWVIARRGGEMLRMNTEDLVPGDVVALKSGDQVPADLRVFEDQGLRADESLLTGESAPVDKSATASVSRDAALSERVTLLHAGTVVASGRGEGVVVATGADTEVGRIAEALAEPRDTDPPLMVRMARFTRIVAIAMVGVILVIAAVEAVRGIPAAEIFLIAVALAVAAIPEGLPVAMTVALSISVSRMAKRNVVVRRLYAVEGLGACTLIASDKTGTLTCNELTVRRLHVPEVGDLTVTGEGYGPQGVVSKDEGELDSREREAVARLVRAGALASETALRFLPDGRVTLLGDSVDAAFHVLSRKFLSESHRDPPEVVSTIPYEPAHRYCASFYIEGETTRAFVKGAFETVFAMCGETGDGSEAHRSPLVDKARLLAEGGYRVLAVAEGPVEEMGVSGLRGLRMLGLVGLIDPLRPEATAAVGACAKAGVDVRMVTGDHPATALAIARELGVALRDDQVVTGAQLASVRDNARQFDEWVANGKVFARIEPLVKLAIVESLKRAGHYVAVTGDGVNDAPALRAAHIGAAMGRSGTDVARQAADLILTDDNFASIVGGIEEGRVAYGNIRKVIYLLISTGSSEVALFLLSLAAGYPVPLTAVQLLWLNLVTQSAQHVGLAFEKAEPGILEEHPRAPEQGIFDRVMIRQTAVSGIWMGALAFFAYVWLSGTDLSRVEVGNRLLLLMVLFENVHVFNCRSETRSIFRIRFFSNRVLLLAVFVAQGLHVFSMYVPGLSRVLGVRPVSLEQWLSTCLAAISVIVVMELAKWVWRRMPPR